MRLEISDSPTASVFLVVGSSGAHYGYAMYDNAAGKYCLRMSPEDYVAAADDICRDRRRFYRVIPVPEWETIEVNEIEDTQDAAPVRARNDAGEFVADNPETEQNEAWTPPSKIKRGRSKK